MVAQNRCKCNCGYSCKHECDLPIMQCMKLHYKKDCEHIWDGPPVVDDRFRSVTCSNCGITALEHDLKHGP